MGHHPTSRASVLVASVWSTDVKQDTLPTGRVSASDDGPTLTPPLVISFVPAAACTFSRSLSPPVSLVSLDHRSVKAKWLIKLWLPAKKRRIAANFAASAAVAACDNWAKTIQTIVC